VPTLCPASSRPRKSRPPLDVLSQLIHAPPEPPPYPQEVYIPSHAVFFWMCAACGEINATVAGSARATCRGEGCSLTALNPEPIVFPPVI